MGEIVFPQEISWIYIILLGCVLCHILYGRKTQKNFLHIYAASQMHLILV